MSVVGAQRRLRDEGGQALVALILVMFSLFAGGLWLFQVGFAATLQAGAQSGADAAALAAAEEMRRQLYTADRPDPAFLDWGAVRAQAEEFAERNDTTVVDFEPRGLDVIVTTASTSGLSGVGAEKVDVGGLQGEVAARARVAVVTVPFAAGSTGGPAENIAPPADAPEFLRRAIEEANRIDALHLPYLWGGGHQSSPAPANGPFDCSGSVSRVLQAAGLPIPTMVSGQFVNIGQPGPGAVTIYANDGHVYMAIDGNLFGTHGTNPGGGAGWYPAGAGNDHTTPGYAVRHIPLDGDFVPEELVGVGVGSAFTPAAFQARYEVILVPLDGDGVSSGAGGPVDGEGLGDPDDPATWEALEQCESSGNPRATNGTHFGLYQFDIPTWESVGGEGNPMDASPEEQRMRARTLYNQRGWQPWECAAMMGWT